MLFSVESVPTFISYFADVLAIRSTEFVPGLGGSMVYHNLTSSPSQASVQYATKQKGTSLG